MSKPATALHTVTEQSARDNVRLIDRRNAHADPDDERTALVAGLFSAPAVISPKYFYDDIGCTLFEAICSLPEYYPTRTERAILTTHRDSIVQAVGTGRQFVDLGAGDCATSCRSSEPHCIKLVTVEMVMQAALELLHDRTCRPNEILRPSMASAGIRLVDAPSVGEAAGVL